MARIASTLAGNVCPTEQFTDAVPESDKPPKHWPIRIDDRKSQQVLCMSALHLHHCLFLRLPSRHVSAGTPASHHLPGYLPEMRNRFLTAFTLLVTIIGVIRATASPTVTTRQDDPSAALGFDSRLWYGTYHPDSPDVPGGPAAGKGSSAQRAAMARQNRLARPGSEQTDGASLAELIVEDHQAEESLDSTRIPLTDWERSRIAAAVPSDPTTMHKVNGSGPTATTILVGVVAAIVAGGALFSGKE